MADIQGLLNEIDSRLAASLLKRIDRRAVSRDASGYVPIPDPMQVMRETKGAPLPRPDPGLYEPPAHMSREGPAPIPPLQNLPPKPTPRAFGSVRRGMGRLRQGAAIVGLEAGDLSPEEAARAMATGALDIAESPAPKETTQGLRKISEAETFGEALEAIVRNPQSALAVVGESLPMSLPSLLGGAAGSFAGPGGTAAGVGLPSMAVEYAASMMEAVQARGVDPQDTEAVATLLGDESFLAEARDRAAKRGVAVGLFDALTGGLAGQLLKGAKGLGSAAVRSLGELGIQAGGGAAGEAAAQAVTEGKITSPGEVLLEGVAEIIPGVGEVALNVAQAGTAPESATPTPPAATEERILELTQAVETKLREKQGAAPQTAQDVLELTTRVEPEPAPAPPITTAAPEVRQEIPSAQPSIKRPALPKRPRRGPPLSLAEFLAQQGIQDQTGELKAMDAHLWHKDKPFRRRLVRDDGLTPDYAREAAAEAGYLPQDSTLADLYEALSEDLAGRTVYSEADRSTAEAAQAKKDEMAVRDENRYRMEQEADRLGLMPKTIANLDDNALAESIASAAQKAGAVPITAYHGSPHAFERFSTEQIGTGEGAQAYGHGLYFSDKKAVAEYYRDALARPAREVGPFAKAQAKKILGADLELLNGDAFRALVSVSIDETVSITDASRRLYARYPGLRAVSGGKTALGPHPNLENLIQEIRQESKEHKGRLYKVSIQALEEDFLDWDKPLSQQSVKMQESFGWTKKLRDEYDKTTREVDNAILEGLTSDAPDTASIDALSRRAHEIERAVGVARNATGEQIMQGDKLFGNVGSPERAAAVQRRGIQGIKYKDAMSRGKEGEGSYNYVVFDEEAVEITEMYTFPGPLADLRKQWEGIADQVIDSLAEGKYSPFAKFFGGYPFKDIALGDLPERGRYLTERGLTQGKIFRVNQVARHLANIFRKSSAEEQRTVFDFLTTKGADPKVLPPKLRGPSVAAKSTIKKVSNVLVRRGLLSQESRDRYADAYLPRVYLKHLMERGTLGSGGIKISDQGYLKQRLELPQEYREFLGEIEDPAFLVTKALSIPGRDMAIQDFLRGLLDNPEWVLPQSILEWTAPGMETPRKVTPFWLKSEAKALRQRAGAMANPEASKRARAIADDMDAQADEALGAVGMKVPLKYARLPDSQRYGELRGLVVRREIANDLRVQNRIWTGDPTAWDKITEGLRTFNAFWKMVKVPLNPPTQMRNFISNSVLLNISGVPAHSMPGLYVRAFNQIRRNGKFYRIAKKYGVPASTFNAEELQRMQPDVIRAKAGQGGMMGTMYRLAEPITKIGAKAGDIYQFSETLGKVVKIIDAMEREGRTEADAVQAAQEALFDYSLVPNLVQQLRTQPIGAPFITFYYKAFPAVIKAAIRHPQRLAPYYIIPYLLGDALLAELKDVDDEDVEKLREALPKWLQDQGHVYIFPFKDESGRWDFVNFGYYLPWAMHERTARNVMQIAGGEYEGSVNDFFSEIGVLGGPVPQVISALMTGKDAFTGRDIVETTDPPKVQMWKLLNYAWRMAGPSWLTDRGVAGHVMRSMEGTPNYYGDEPLSMPQAAARGVGLNIYPTDPSVSRQRNIRRKAFEIKEAGRAAKRVGRNRSLSQERKEDLRAQYREEIDAMVLDLQRYREESAVHPNLR